MTVARLVSDSPDSQLARALRDAAWSDAGIEIDDDRADVTLAVALNGIDDATWSEWTARGPVVLIGPTAHALGSRLPQAPLGQPGPVHQVRVRPQGALAAPDLIVTDQVHPWPVVDVVGAVHATANVAYRDHAVAVAFPEQGVGVLTMGSAPATWQDRGFLRFVHRFVHRVIAGGSPEGAPEPIRVGLLGYGAIGHEHAKAIRAVQGLDLVAVVDPNPQRVHAAREFTPGLAAFDDGDAMLASPDVDAIVVSTPPDSHAAWSIAALQAGKHVILEKPMALTTAECDSAMALASRVNRSLVVYQNRRYDPDFRAIRAAVDDDRLGEVFHLEAFVGGYHHPCNYWHSDAEVSGGALFDWGSHIVDQILDLMPGSVAAVSALNHKRVWLDVTNADHARMTLHFEDGREATFITSDLAAVRKPRWYLLGTQGGIIGDWRVERVVGRSAIGTLDEDVLAPADSPPVLSLHGADGSITALPGRPAAPNTFHSEWQQWITEGIPMTVSAAQSRRVIAMLEAAERSAAQGGAPVAPA